MRERIAGEVTEEQRKNFAPYRKSSCRKRKGKAPAPFHSKKPRCWSLKFVCLANKDETHVPSTVAAKEVLVQAGLGEKKIEVDVENSTQSFREQLYAYFPKLRNAGGFELMRCMANSRILEPISYSTAQFPKLLKKVIGNSRTYIRPLQKDLDVTPEESTESPELGLYTYLLVFKTYMIINILLYR
jgi:hypothetical protein